MSFMQPASVHGEEGLRQLISDASICKGTKFYKMFIFHHINDLSAYLEERRRHGAAIGFVPTMGALHEGHLSLVDKARSHTDVVVCSIFVNPAQFNNPADLESYPQTIDEDIYKLEMHGCDVLFLPPVGEMYPEGIAERIDVDLGPVAEKLEGLFRPGHFRGMATIVDKLLTVVNPRCLFMGQKDYQQSLVVKELLARTHRDVELHIVPTKREPDGLAMSSRNMRLTEGERQQANLIYQCLVSIQAQSGIKPFRIVQKECADLLEKKGIRPEYILLCNADTLEALDDYDRSQPMIALIAVFIGEIRLIDNLVL